MIRAASAVRAAGCASLPGANTPLRTDPGLDAVARELLRGRPLEDALQRVNYRVTAATSIRIGIVGRSDDAIAARMREALATRFCAPLAGAEYTAIGAASDGRHAWLVLAEPFAPPAPERAGEVTARVLELVNAARTRGGHCGDARFEPAAPLTRSEALDRAAAAHVRDMVALGALTHRGSDGGKAADRIRRQGYAWSHVGENLASGATSAEQVVAGWFDSSAHCTNLMNPDFAETGIAYALSDTGAGEIYWVQVFAAP